MPATTEQRVHLVKVYEHDTSKPLAPGTNPLPLFNIPIPYETTLPRRERAAINAVRSRTNREAAIAHSPNGDMVATLVTQPIAAPTRKRSANVVDAEMMTKLLQSPTVQQELQRIMRAGK
jgi:hypothetical protein